MRVVVFVDLATRWARKVILDEFVVTETRVPDPMPKMNAYTIRHILMRLVSKEEFEKKVPAPSLEMLRSSEAATTPLLFR